MTKRKYLSGTEIAQLFQQLTSLDITRKQKKT
jgi:hypothetical protein